MVDHYKIVAGSILRRLGVRSKRNGLVGARLIVLIRLRAGQFFRDRINDQVAVVIIYGQILKDCRAVAACGLLCDHFAGGVLYYDLEALGKSAVDFLQDLQAAGVLDVLKLKRTDVVSAAAVKKVGFAVPVRKWLADSRYNGRVREALFGDIADRFFNRDALGELWERFVGGEETLGGRVYAIYAFLLWYELKF
jgi:hypothetical protein